MRVQRISGLLIIHLVFFYGSVVAGLSLQERETLPAPIVVAPSQEWDGDDGSWSSFPIQVGTPSQLLRVFVSTALHQTSVVLPQGCVTTDPTDCANLRGGEFKLNESSTWVKNTANLSSDIYPFLVGQQLGYTGKARLGFDDLTLDWAGAGGPSLKNQTIAGIATKDSYLGVLGLAPRASNFTSFNNPIPSLMQNLKNQSLIPSTSYGYTAGNQYRLNQVLGSLTLGGYDRSKFVPHGITWSLYAQDVRDLTVQIDAITSTTSTSTSPTSLLPKSIPAFLDSSLPYIWLPAEACALFEKAFNLTWNNATELYTLTDAQHQALSAQNPNITFTLGNLTAGAQVNISLPYAAFDLTAVPPFVTNTTKYFPLKRAANYTQYTLGRTFFQEAYVIADYDRGNFSVSQCSWVAGAGQDIVAIRPVSTTSTGNGTTGGTNPTSPTSHSSSAGAIAGGVVGGLAVLAVAAFLLYRFCIKPRRHAKEAAEAATAAALAGSAEKANPPTQDTPDPAFFKPELDASSPAALSEMEGHKMQLGSVEAAGTPVEIYELPVDLSPQHELPSSDPTGAELPSGREAHEMHQPERFSWEATPVDGVPSQPPRWSWITTPGGAGPSASSEKDAMSPRSPPGPPQ